MLQNADVLTGRGRIEEVNGNQDIKDCAWILLFQPQWGLSAELLIFD